MPDTPANPNSASPTPSIPDAPPAPATQGLSLNALRFSKTEISSLPTAVPIPEPEAAISDEVFMTPTQEPSWKLAVKAAAIFLTTFALVFGTLESPALSARAAYWFKNFRAKPTPELAFLPRLQDRAVTITEIKNRPQEFLDPNAQLAGYSLADLSDNTLLIPKISVKAPIIWGSAADEETMLANLQKGVVHYGFTALPSDGTGKVFISGHSSYTLWDPGQYKTVFANLDRLEIGDQLAVTYQGVVYIYQVFDKVVVKPQDISVLDQTSEPTLSLMTCVPVGTNLNRLVVTSRLVSASINQPVPLAPQELTDPAAIFSYLPF